MNQSVWHESVKEDPRLPAKPPEGNLETDVLIIGGGMAGVLCAYKLKQAGVACVLVEAKRIGSGVTGNTTAKITAQHGLIYEKLIKKYGLDAARKYYEANSLARDEYERLSAHFPCDFESRTAYIYSLTDRKKLEDEAKAYEKLSIRPVFQERPPLPFGVAGALGMENQAQFNPLKLLFAVANELNIHEDTFVSEIKGNTAFTKHGTITAKSIVLATHFPMVNIPGLYFAKMYQHRSYVIALENAPELNGMYLDEQENGHSFRNYKGLLLLGGGDHKTGKTGGGYEELRGLAKSVYPNAGGLTESFPPASAFVGESLWGLVYLTFIASAAAMLCQTYGQRHASPSAASILLSQEAVFGVACSTLLYGEVLTPRLILGFAVIFAAVITSETKWSFLRGRKKAQSGADA